MRKLKEEKVLAETLSSSCSVCHTLSNLGAVFLLLESEVSTYVVQVALMSQGDIVVASMVTMVLCCKSKKEKAVSFGFVCCSKNSENSNDLQLYFPETYSTSYMITYKGQSLQNLLFFWWLLIGWFEFYETSSMISICISMKAVALDFWASVGETKGPKRRLIALFG